MSSLSCSQIGPSVCETGQGASGDGDNLCTALRNMPALYKKQEIRCLVWGSPQGLAADGGVSRLTQQYNIV